MSRWPRSENVLQSQSWKTEIKFFLHFDVHMVVNRLLVNRLTALVILRLE